ncbi:MAG: phosphoribosylglycinamide formyltransferase [Gammaproteobacteria bacterium]|nr:phosphoribosylglycinamide formyltransferase [Gammaproteobacteria bacterium]MBL6998776.1 phosphoribosylglycinamide formyltransferase [Gammaproteobacteria bacterium]
MPTLSLVVLISGSGSNLQAIIDAIENGQLDAKIQAVISNRPDAYGLTRARQHGVSAISLDHKAFDTREQFDQQLQQQIKRLQPDIIVLAGYMRILTSDFIDHFFPRILNIHPSLLPKYQGLHTHQRALDNKDREHGVSIHVVTPELDAGPVIIQGKFPVEEADDSDSLQQKAHQLEHQMYPLVLQWISQQRLRITQESTVFDNEIITQPLLFNTLIDAS